MYLFPSHDPSTESLRTSTVVTFPGGDVDVEISASDGDNIAISDGTNTLIVNPDGSINVKFQEPSVINEFNEINSVSSGVTTSILSYTALDDGKLKQISVSGSNIAMYEILVDSNLVDKCYTYFGGSLNYIFDFKDGYDITSGQNILVRVTHNRPFVGDFNARLQYVEAV